MAKKILLVVCVLIVSGVFQEALSRTPWFVDHSRVTPNVFAVTLSPPVGNITESPCPSFPVKVEGRVFIQTVPGLCEITLEISRIGPPMRHHEDRGHPHRHGRGKRAIKHGRPPLGRPRPDHWNKRGKPLRATYTFFISGPGPTVVRGDECPRYPIFYRQRNLILETVKGKCELVIDLRGQRPGPHDDINHRPQNDQGGTNQNGNRGPPHHRDKLNKWPDGHGKHRDNQGKGPQPGRGGGPGRGRDNQGKGPQPGRGGGPDRGRDNQGKGPQPGRGRGNQGKGDRGPPTDQRREQQGGGKQGPPPGRGRGNQGTGNRGGARGKGRGRG